MCGVILVMRFHVTCAFLQSWDFIANYHGLNLLKNSEIAINNILVVFFFSFLSSFPLLFPCFPFLHGHKRFSLSGLQGVRLGDARGGGPHLEQDGGGHSEPHRLAELGLPCCPQREEGGLPQCLCHLCWWAHPQGTFEFEFFLFIYNFFQLFSFSVLSVTFFFFFSMYVYIFLIR